MGWKELISVGRRTAVLPTDHTHLLARWLPPPARECILPARILCLFGAGMGICVVVPHLPHEWFWCFPGGFDDRPKRNRCLQFGCAHGIVWRQNSASHRMVRFRVSQRVRRTGNAHFRTTRWHRVQCCGGLLPDVSDVHRLVGSPGGTRHRILDRTGGVPLRPREPRDTSDAALYWIVGIDDGRNGARVPSLSLYRHGRRSSRCLRLLPKSLHRGLSLRVQSIRLIEGMKE
mmetsp:Transcript_8152/g.24106  ORF Transcript_8152/g.24106 Transcript_8152/m.24106 type:complete len:231 (+) Transcript_8152:1512-2204(+)